MNRKLNYKISQSDAGLHVEQFLRRQGYSKQNLTNLKKMPESILVNGQWYYLKQALQAGDELAIHIQETESSEHIPPVKLPLDILYEDEDLLVINKPAGMPIHPSRNNYENTLANGLAWYFEKQGIAFTFRCTNRLDRDTSGLTIVAKHMLSSSIFYEMVRSRQVHREYLAIVRGKVTPASGTIDAPLARKEGILVERMVDFAHGEPAVTHYQALEYQNGHSLVSLQLETGRTHQIRVHMKYFGYPLVGDYLYNPDMEFIKRQALHSYRMKFIHPITKKPMEFTAPLPGDMAQFGFTHTINGFPRPSG